MALDPAAVIGEMVRRTRRSAPGDLAPLVAGSAAAAGLSDAVIYLADYGQTRLLPLPYPGMAPRVPLGVESTLAGRAYRTGLVHAGDGDPGARRLWLPLARAAERLGVLEVAVPAAEEDAVREGELEHFADMVATLLVDPLGVRGRLRAGPPGPADAAAGGDPVAAAAADRR